MNKLEMNFFRLIFMCRVKQTFLISLTSTHRRMHLIFFFELRTFAGAISVANEDFVCSRPFLSAMFCLFLNHHQLLASFKLAAGNTGQLLSRSYVYIVYVRPCHFRVA